MPGFSSVCARPRCQTTKSVEPARYSHRATALELNCLKLKPSGFFPPPYGLKRAATSAERARAISRQPETSPCSRMAARAAATTVVGWPSSSRARDAERRLVQARKREVRGIAQHRTIISCPLLVLDPLLRVHTQAHGEAAGRAQIEGEAAAAGGGAPAVTAFDGRLGGRDQDATRVAQYVELRAVPRRLAERRSAARARDAPRR